MSRVEENDHVELTSGEGKEEVAQLNGSGAFAAFSPRGSGTGMNERCFFFSAFFCSSRRTAIYETKGCAVWVHNSLHPRFHWLDMPVYRQERVAPGHCPPQLASQACQRALVSGGNLAE